MLGGLQQEGAGAASQLAVDTDRSLAVGEQTPRHRNDTVRAGQLEEGLLVGSDDTRGHCSTPVVSASSVWKHVRSPVWHAGPTWSTRTSNVSPSQSMATERTY